jgi:pyruvate,water dikinase
MKYFNYGDILVTIMTSPDFVVVMKKAAAIITDEGGLTSHAAIISRELEKPCIVGTRSASRILKDGDLVEVDANLGVVRKI